MQTFINEFKEPSFTRTYSELNCKVKEQTQLKTLRETNKLYLARLYLNKINKIKEFLKIPNKSRMIRLSSHVWQEYGYPKKELNKNITTKLSNFKGITTVEVFTDIDNVFLNPKRQ